MRLRNFEAKLFFALVLLITAIFVWMVRGFLMPIFWAAVFAILFQPVFVRLVEMLKGSRSAAAAVSTLLVVLVLVIPFGLIGAAVVQQALSLYARLAAGEVGLYAPIRWVERSLPWATELLASYGVDIERLRVGLEAAAVGTTQWIAGRTLIFGQNVLMVTVLFVLMLYFLFFFFRDGERIMSGAVRALPMGDERERRLFAKFAQVSRATVKGTLIVAIVQGALGGILFALVGIEGAVFWAVVMAILSLLPAVGPALVWGPAAVILITMGEVASGVIVIVAGTVVVGLVDNLLRPILVGRETQMPDYLVLLATLGGLSAFGLAGFVVGPIIAALFLVMWEMFADEYAVLDSSEPPATPTAPPDNPPPAGKAVSS
jgi:predicted PurR-regulated permease PerM